MTEQGVQTATEALEIERKYEAEVHLRLPDAEAFRAAGFAAGKPVTHRLSARYFDSPGCDLARQGVAVRVREGGKDAGWHLKQRGEAGVREVAWPPAAEMPAELREMIRERIDGDADRLITIAALETERTIVLLGEAGEADRTAGASSTRAADRAASTDPDDSAVRAVIELADDRVRAYTQLTDTHRAWREWEAELLPGADARVLDRVEPLLLAAGAQHSLSFAKVARASGQLIAAARAAGASAEQLAALERLDASDQEAARRLGA